MQAARPLAGGARAVALLHHGQLLLVAFAPNSSHQAVTQGGGSLAMLLLVHQTAGYGLPNPSFKRTCHGRPLNSNVSHQGLPLLRLIHVDDASPLKQSQNVPS